MKSSGGAPPGHGNSLGGTKAPAATVSARVMVVSGNRRRARSSQSVADFDAEGSSRQRESATRITLIENMVLPEAIELSSLRNTVPLLPIPDHHFFPVVPLGQVGVMLFAHQANPFWVVVASTA